MGQTKHLIYVILFYKTLGFHFKTPIYHIVKYYRLLNLGNIELNDSHTNSKSQKS